jgi:pimeloyl-ACP methyl ester carboxylesterase
MPSHIGWQRRLPRIAYETADIRKAGANGIEIAYETFGQEGDPPVLLVMGLATQMLGWNEGLCEQLAGRGRFVVRFDNRDIGLSTHLEDAPVPNLQRIFAGDTDSAVYTLSDMADDTVGLMDALGLDSAHLVGASMGGMIGQTVALEHPERVRSLTSIMSTTGDPNVGNPTEEAMQALLAPPPRSRDEAMERAVQTYGVIGSPGFPLDEAGLRERAGMSWDRAIHDPSGIIRQLAAIWASGDRTGRLSEIAAPVTVIHGADDPLISVSGGRATAKAMADAELEVIEGMGHDLPRDAWEQIVDAIDRTVKRGEERRS